MRKYLLGLVAVAALGFACLAPVNQADAQWGGHYGGYRSHYGHGHGGHGHGGHGHGGYYGRYHRGHYDYHRPSLQWHGNHFDYVPGHYHYHHGNHYHW